MQFPCTVVRKLYPYFADEEVNFMMVLCRSDPSNIPFKSNGEFIAKGTLLPANAGCKVVFDGKWTKASSPQLNVTDFYLPDMDSYEELRDYLVSIPGISKRAATGLINQYRFDTLSVLDEDPGVLSNFVSEKVLQKAEDNLQIRRRKRPIFEFLLPYFRRERCQPADAMSAALRIPSIKALQTSPYSYSIDAGVPFQVAEKIAKDFSVPADTIEGGMAAILEVLHQTEGTSIRADVIGAVSGNTYCDRTTLFGKAATLIDVFYDNPVVPKAYGRLLEDGLITETHNKCVYRKATYSAEAGVARELLRLKSAGSGIVDDIRLREDINSYEMKSHLRLAPEQRAAVKTAVKNPVTLLIGGPGTGKTTIERFIIRMFRTMHPDRKVLLVAPTGKAACRMAEATGDMAYTVHAALGITADKEVLCTDKMLDAGLVLIDEASMLGSQESYALFHAIPTGAQVVIVGDTNQLPSVGPGNVLYELIQSKQFAISELRTVYRQKAGSTIAINCARIKLGYVDLDEVAGVFEFLEVSTEEEAVAAILDAFQKEVSRGRAIDDICLLSPFRQSTLTGTDSLNEKIQAIVADKETSPMIRYGKREFFLNDKVIYKVNKGMRVNGDVGTIKEIAGNRFKVDFGDSDETFHKNDLRDFDLAFATTIHKSQGMEFPCCIIVATNAHKKMLNRNIIYTAVSRAKEKVIIVGQREALRSAIQSEDVTRRKSLLSTFLTESY